MPTTTKNKLPLFFILLLLIMGTGLPPVQANFCKEEADSRGKDDAKMLETELFSQPVSGDTVNLDFNRGYNARLITCNRKRDGKGNKIEKEIGATHKFSANLEPKTVKGHFSYMGLGIFSSLRYAYELSRSEGTWVVTVPIEFHWPEGRMTDSVDIPMELAESLNLHIPGQICDPAATVPSAKNPRLVERGFIDAYLDPPQSEIFVKDQIAMDVPQNEIVTRREDIKENSIAEGILDASYDVMYYWEESACRVPRNLVVDNTSVLNHLRLYWQKAITEVWNRPGFEIRPLFINCEKQPEGASTAPCSTPTAAQLSAWEKDETIWKVRFNLKPFHRPSFKRWVAKWNHMHTGTDGTTIGHEIGHYLGLDDEYGEKDKSKKECSNILPGAELHYIMCESDAGRAGAQGVYPWIMTRRYAIAKEYQCKRDSDCDGGEFCDEGTLSLGRNVCKDLRSEGEGCSRDAQCASGAICKGKPAGKCIFEASVELGGDCFKDAQCVTGSCDKDDHCQCKKDGDCSSGQYCKNTVIGKNSCVNLKAEEASCSSDSQCTSPAICKGKPLGKCIIESSVSLGGSCVKDTQCVTGSCDKDGRCQCKAESDCPSGQYCQNTAVGKNTCAAFKANGASCSQDSQCRAPAICKGKPFGKCITESSKGLGDSCTKDAECRVGKCGSNDRCQCTKDDQCPRGQKCKEPFGKPNYCQ